MWMRCPSCASHEMPLTVWPIACADARDVLAARTHVKPRTRRKRFMRGGEAEGVDGDRYETLALPVAHRQGSATLTRRVARASDPRWTHASPARRTRRAEPRSPPRRRQPAA